MLLLSRCSSPHKTRVRLGKLQQRYLNIVAYQWVQAGLTEVTLSQNAQLFFQAVLHCIETEALLVFTPVTERSFFNQFVNARVFFMEVQHLYNALRLVFKWVTQCSLFFYAVCQHTLKKHCIECSQFSITFYS